MSLSRTRSPALARRSAARHPPRGGRDRQAPGAQRPSCVAKIRETESELFRQLATVRLDPAMQAELDGPARARPRRKAREHAQGARRASSSAAEAALEDARHDDRRAERASAPSCSSEVETQQAELKALASRIAGDAIAGDPDYAASARASRRAGARSPTRAMRKTEQAEADREEKGKPYRDDPLFMYLWERGYGTTNYRANNLVRYLDGLVARLVGFPQGAAQLRHAQRNSAAAARARRAAAARLPTRREAEVGALEDAAIDAAGGKPMREALDAAQAADRRDRRRDGRAPRTSATRRPRRSASWRRAAIRRSPARCRRWPKRWGARTSRPCSPRRGATRTGQDDTIVAADRRCAQPRRRGRSRDARPEGSGSRRWRRGGASSRTSSSSSRSSASTIRARRFGEDKLVGDCSTISCAAGSPRRPTGTSGSAARTGSGGRRARGGSDCPRQQRQ